MCSFVIVSNGTAEFDGTYVLSNGLTNGRRSYYSALTKKHIFFAAYPIARFELWLISSALGQISYGPSVRFIYTNVTLPEDISGSWQQLVNDVQSDVPLILSCGCNGNTTWLPAGANKCKFVTECATQAVAPTPTSDRVCLKVTTCTSVEYETAAPTFTTDRQCRTATTCRSTGYETVVLTSKADRQCRTATTCNFAEYETAASTSTSDQHCRTATTCTSTEYETVALTSTAD